MPSLALARSTRKPVQLINLTMAARLLAERNHIAIIARLHGDQTLLDDLRDSDSLIVISPFGLKDRLYGLMLVRHTAAQRQRLKKLLGGAIYETGETRCPALCVDCELEIGAAVVGHLLEMAGEDQASCCTVWN